MLSEPDSPTQGTVIIKKAATKNWEWNQLGRDIDIAISHCKKNKRDSRLHLELYLWEKCKIIQQLSNCSGRVRTHALVWPSGHLNYIERKKEKEKRREEANTPEISLVVLHNMEEVNSQETFTCILWELMNIPVWFIEEMLWTLQQFDRLSNQLLCQIGLVDILFQNAWFKGSKRKLNTAKRQPSSHWSRPPQNGS